MEISKISRSKKIRAFILITILTSLAVNIKILHKEIKAYRKNKIDVAVEYETKLQSVRQIIPPGENICFINDETRSGTFCESLSLTQYVLAPVKVFPNQLSKYVIASFNDPLGKDRYIKDNSLSLLKEIDPKTALYIKRTE